MLRRVSHSITLKTLPQTTSSTRIFISEAAHSKLVRRCKPERGDIVMTRITAGVLGDTRILDWDVEKRALLNATPKKINMRDIRPSRESTATRSTERLC